MVSPLAQTIVAVICKAIGRFNNSWQGNALLMFDARAALRTAGIIALRWYSSCLGQLKRCKKSGFIELPSVSAIVRF
jgi:hypothetical protein